MNLPAADMNSFRLAVLLSNRDVAQAIADRVHRADVGIGGDPVESNAVMTTDPSSVAQFLQSKKHALLVADHSPTRENIQNLQSLARMHDVQFALWNPDRFLPSRQLVRRQIEGALGEPGLIRMHRWGPIEDAIGMILRDIDVTLWLANAIPDRVFAVERTIANSDLRILQIHIGFPGGAMALLDHVGTNSIGEGYTSLSVIARSGAAYADDENNMQLVIRGDRTRAIRTDERVPQLAAMAQAFVDGLDTNRDLTAETDGWQSSFAVADAAQRSLATGRAVTAEAR